MGKTKKTQGDSAWRSLTPSDRAKLRNSAWWFKEHNWIIFPFSWEFPSIPTDFHIFQRGRLNNQAVFRQKLTKVFRMGLCHGFSMALIEIDDFPSERNPHLWLGLWTFHGELLVITRG